MMAWSGVKAAVSGAWPGRGGRAGEQAWRRAHGIPTMRRDMRRVRRATGVVAALALLSVVAAGTGTTAVNAATVVGATRPTKAPTPGSVRILLTPLTPVPSVLANPGNWKTSGYACNKSSHGYTTWCDMLLGIYVTVNKVVTDKVLVRITVNPGARVSKVSYTAKYTPNHGRLSQMHLITYPLCYIKRENCGSDELDRLVLSKNGVLLYPRTPNMRGHQVGLGIDFGAFCKSCTNGHYANDSFRTGMATCNKSNNNCYYP